MTFTAANTTKPIVENIENVNVELDYFKGTATDIDMTNYKNSSVTLGSSKLGFNGVTGALAVGANTVKAGSNVDTFTVAGLTTGTVDAGSAKTVTVTGLSTIATKVIVNGDITTGTGLTLTTADKVTLDFTADSKVKLDTAASATTTLTGDKNVELTMVAADVVTASKLIDNTTAGTVTLKTGGASFQTTNFEVDKIIIDGTATQAATLASGQTLETSADIATSLTIDTAAATATEVTLNLGHDVKLLDVKDDKLVTTINNTDSNSIGTLTAIDEKVIVKGAGNITIGNADVKTLDASAATGEMALTFKAATATASTVSGTTGKNSITMGNVGDTLSYTGQSGVDTLNVVTALTGTVAGDLGAGNDVLNFVGAVAAGATIAVQGGAGTDVIKVTDGANLAAITGTGTWAVSGFEEIQVQGVVNSAVTATTLTMLGSMLDGTTYNVTTKEAIDTVALTVTLDKTSTDLSGLKFGAGDTVAINATNKSYNVIGTSVADTITLGNLEAGKNATITTGAGKDTIVVADSNSVQAQMVKITDFSATASTTDFDKLDLDATGIVANTTVNVKEKGVDGTTALYSAAANIFADATNDVNLVVKDGFMTLSGLSADVALADTLSEMVTLALTAAADATENSIAFVFDGNTYLVKDAGNETAADKANDAAYVAGTTDVVLELSGLTTAKALGTAAAADTILIA